MSIKYPELPKWVFEVEEVSAGIFKVCGESVLGANIEKVGTDPDALLEECRLYAQEREANP